jgi:hypothetical protein
VGKKLQETQKAMEQARRQEKEQNIMFRTLDKDLNTIRPDLMKLQGRKDALHKWVPSHQCAIYTVETLSKDTPEISTPR